MSETKFVKHYEWVGDVCSHTEAPPTEFSVSYKEPDRTFDKDLKADPSYIDTLPDLQNGPSSLIQGSPVEIQQVGIHNFRLPLRFKKKTGGTIELETSVTGTVSLESHKKGINMSRLMREFYKFQDETFHVDKLKEILLTYKEKLKSFDARILLSFSYPIIQKSLRSDNQGYQYYKVTLEGDLNKNGDFRKVMHFNYLYSSSCPCSFELSQHAVKYRNKAVVPHSQRSTTMVSVEFDEMVWIEDLKDICLEALKTETQVIVKREDEQAFAELNGSYLKFVEDAARLLYQELSKESKIKDFRVVCSHLESLHSHNACSIIAPPNTKFSLDIPVEVYNSMIL
jgi:GTP cyclohydrolase IB